MKDHSRTARRLTFLLFLTQVCGSAGFIAAHTVSPIVGAELGGQPAYAGVPPAVFQSATALSALLWGRTMDRIGRRGGLALGLAVGAVGAGVAVGAVVAGSLLAFLLGLAGMGAANAAVQLARFAAAEIHEPAQRGKAISNVVIGGAAGAVFGPLMVGPTGALALLVGVNELSGPYSVGLVLFALASVMIFLGLRPDPRDLGRELARLHPEQLLHKGPTRSLREILRVPAVRVAMIAMVLGQMVMLMVMAITALHMKDHQHSLTDVSLVISSHTFGMYALSILSGRLTDRWGRERTIMAGAGMLVVSCLVAPLSPDVVPLAVTLLVLGFGWNLCFVGGSSLLADQLSPAERSRTQGFNDLLMGSASATGSLGSGLLFATVGYGGMTLFSAMASLVPLGATLWWLGGRRLVATR